MQGVHRLGSTDRKLMWGTAVLIAFTLGAVAFARTNSDPRAVQDTAKVCYNSAGVGSACLPEPEPLTTTADFAPTGDAASSSAPPATATTTPSATTTSPPGATPTKAGGGTTSGVPTSGRTTPGKPVTNAKKPAYPAWQVGVPYREGDRVTYRDRVYACTQAHTSQSDWSPVDAPVLWTKVG